MRNLSKIISIMIVISLLFSVSVYADGSNIEANGVQLYSLSNSQVDGNVNIQGETNKSGIKLLVVKNKEQAWYDVKLENNQFKQQLWLNKGVGKYTIYVMVKEYGEQYSFGPKLTVENVKELNEYLSPDMHIESNDKQIEQKAQEIITGLSSDMEKAKAIYQWVADYVAYDYEKYAKHLNNNFNNEYGALLALNTKQGVCYDYAALVAALGRAAGLQTKLVKGTGKLGDVGSYHAWNEMYISEQDQWIKLDATYASVLKQDFFNNEDFDESHIAE